LLGKRKIDATLNVGVVGGNENPFLLARRSVAMSANSSQRIGEAAAKQRNSISDKLDSSRNVESRRGSKIDNGRNSPDSQVVQIECNLLHHNGGCSPDSQVVQNFR